MLEGANMKCSLIADTVSVSFIPWENNLPIGNTCFKTAHILSPSHLILETYPREKIFYLKRHFKENKEHCVYFDVQYSQSRHTA